jgi:hypothetical protein
MQKALCLFEVSDDNEGLEEVVNVYKRERDRIANFHAGQLLKLLFKQYDAKKIESVFCQAISDLCISANSLDRARSH